MVVNFPPTDPSAPGYSLTHTEPSGVTWEYDGEKWRVTGGSGGSGGGGSSYGDDDVDLHLNTASAGNNQVLSWTGSDYDWVNQSVGGGGGDLNKSDADTYYLSKTGPDTAAGAISFQGLTTHEAGVKVTGGDVTIGNGIVKDGDIFRMVSNDKVALNYHDDTQHLSLTGGGNNSGTKVSGGTDDRQVGFGFSVNTESVPAAAGDRVDQGNIAIRAQTVLKPGKTVKHVSHFLANSNDNVQVADVENVYGYVAAQQLFTGYNVYGFYSELNSTGNAGGLTYAFYSDGTASSFSKASFSFGADALTNSGGMQTWTSGNGASIGGGSIFCTTENANGSYSCLHLNRIGSTDGTFIRFGENGTVKGTIKLDGSGGVIGPVASDYRLKENIVDLPSSVDLVKALRPVNYNFKSHPGQTRPGFIAHELAATLPIAVTGEKDATEAVGTYTDPDGLVETEVPQPEAIPYGATWEQTSIREDYQMIDHNKLIPVLTKALQETIAKNEDLEARLAVLEGN